MLLKLMKAIAKVITKLDDEGVHVSNYINTNENPSQEIMTSEHQKCVALYVSMQEMDGFSITVEKV